MIKTIQLFFINPVQSLLLLFVSLYLKQPEQPTRPNLSNIRQHELSHWEA
jgi:hypothetical protein